MARYGRGATAASAVAEPDDAEALDFALKRYAALRRPKTREALWLWCKKLLGMHIPRVAVCAHHQAPFDFLVAAYFHEHPSLLALANRDGGKTWLFAALHLLNSMAKPGIWTFHVGAVGEQASRCYDRFSTMARFAWFRESVNGEPLLSKTYFTNGAKVEIHTGTVAGVSGPHAQVLAFDEVEQADPVAIEHAKSIPSSLTQTPDGKPIAEPVPALAAYGSTRHVTGGIMQQMINEARRTGNRKVFAWCWKETVERCARACKADPIYGDCPLWEVCKGDAHRSDGFKPVADVIAKFREVGGAASVTWAVQHECREPGAVAAGPFGAYRDELHRLPQAPQLLGQLPVYVNCDFNVDPMVWELWQPRPELGTPLVCVRELALRHVRTAQMCEHLLEVLGPGWRGDVTFFGDATGNNRHTQSVESDWQIIRRYFRTFPARVHYRVPEAAQGNPPVKLGINTTNWCLGENPERRSFLKVTPQADFLLGDWQGCTYHPGTTVPLEDARKFPDRWHACKAAWYMLVLKQPELAAGLPAGARPTGAGGVGRARGLVGTGQVGYVGRMYGGR